MTYNPQVLHYNTFKLPTKKSVLNEQIIRYCAPRFNGSAKTIPLYKAEHMKIAAIVHDMSEVDVNLVLTQNTQNQFLNTKERIDQMSKKPLSVARRPYQRGETISLRGRHESLVICCMGMSHPENIAVNSRTHRLIGDQIQGTKGGIKKGFVDPSVVNKQ